MHKSKKNSPLTIKFIIFTKKIERIAKKFFIKKLKLNLIEEEKKSNKKLKKLQAKV